MTSKIALHLGTCALLVISCLAGACKSSDADNTGATSTVVHIVHYQPSGLKGYMLVFDAADREQSPDTRFYLWRGNHPPKKLPSSEPYMFAMDQCVAGDSNTVVYIRETDDSTYLIALRCGARQVADTLYAGAIEAADNPIALDCRLICSIRDSLFLFDDWRKHGRESMVLWKLSPERQWIRARVLPRLQGYDIAHDFTQMYFCTDSVPPYDIPWGTLFVLDLARDSLYPATEAGTGIKQARRRSQDEPIFLLKKWEKDTNIWAYRPGLGAQKLTDVLPPKEIVDIQFFEDSLRYSVAPSENGYYAVGYLPLGPLFEQSLNK